MSLFHIHIDASWLSPEFECEVTSALGFYRTDFVGPDGGRTEPLNHLTLKLREGNAFRTAFARVVEAAQNGERMRGYIEGEYIASDCEITTAPFDDTVPLPFAVIMEPLPSGAFRKSEFHVAMCAERSDPRLLRALHSMGLLTIYVPKPWGVSVVFTTQGSRADVARMATALHGYLTRAGGGVECSIKEERVVNWWISPGNSWMPPVAQKITWNGDPIRDCRTLQLARGSQRFSLGRRKL